MPSISSEHYVKNIFNLICLALFTMGFLSSCEKDEVKAEFLGGTAPVLTSSTDAIDMSFANADNIGIKLDWTLFDGFEKYRKNRVNALNRVKIENSENLLPLISDSFLNHLRLHSHFL